VAIYKLISSNSVDEHMLNMAERKAALNDTMLEEVRTTQSFFNDLFQVKLMFFFLGFLEERPNQSLGIEISIVRSVRRRSS
jgi:hypothetical protein